MRVRRREYSGLRRGGGDPGHDHRGQVSPTEGYNAIANGTKSQLWNDTRAQLQRSNVDTGAYTDLFRPHLPLQIVMAILTGHADQMSSLFPQTRLIKGLTSGLVPGGVNIEQPLKAAMRNIPGAERIPDYDAYEQYRIDRMIANLVATGKATPTEALIALVERKGPLYQLAQSQAGQESALQIIPSLAIFPAGSGRYYKAALERDQLVDSEVTRLGGDPARMTNTAEWDYLHANGATGANSAISKLYDSASGARHAQRGDEGTGRADEGPAHAGGFGISPTRSQRSTAGSSGRARGRLPDLHAAQGHAGLLQGHDGATRRDGRSASVRTCRSPLM